MVHQPGEMSHGRRDASSWGEVTTHQPRALPWLLPAASAVAASALIGALVTALASSLAGVAAAVLGVVAVLAWVATQPRLVLIRAGARPLREGEHPRLVNVVGGVAADLGLKEPSIRVIEEGEPNALASYVGAPVVGISTSFLDALTRTELEAVVAQTLLRTEPSIVRSYAVEAALGPLAGSFRRPVGPDDDLRTCAVTRYPPALAAALAKASAGAVPRAAFWLVGRDERHASPEERIAALLDL
ncbi:MAG: hypothetical protein ACR2LG_08990 [Actinomycetota bacterium]|nr:hypothetical protein [Actinomycetota bacterium]